MVHLYVGACGIKYDMDKFVDTLHGNLLPYKTKQGTHVQLAVRPIQFYELVFPKESLPSVLKGLGYSGQEEFHKGNNDKLKLAVMRKALGCKKIPKLNYKDVNPITCYRPFVRVYPIGIKHDGKWTKEAAEKCGAIEGNETL